MISEITIKISIGPEGVIVPKESATVAESNIPLPAPPQRSETISVAEMLVPPPPEAVERATAVEVLVPPPPMLEGVAEVGAPVPPIPEV